MRNTMTLAALLMIGMLSAGSSLANEMMDPGQRQAMMDQARMEMRALEDKQRDEMRALEDRFHAEKRTLFERHQKEREALKQKFMAQKQ